MIALALALEIGANAPDELKPCPLPHIERQAGHGLYTHIRRIKTTCEPVGPLSSFAERGEEIDYTPAPEAPSLGGPVVAFAPEAPALEADDSWAVAGPYAGSYGDASAFGPLVGMDAGPAVAIYTPIPSAPEPETWLLMVAGLVAVRCYPGWLRGRGRIQTAPSR